MKHNRQAYRQQQRQADAHNSWKTPIYFCGKCGHWEKVSNDKLLDWYRYFGFVHCSECKGFQIMRRVNEYELPGKLQAIHERKRVAGIPPIVERNPVYMAVRAA